ncbi:MAG TPA: UbiD family decarboxylase, partial [Chloroflexota bacterium]|nr:UbiD family decarboxylase [Chloroflexota bacterium]
MACEDLREHISCLKQHDLIRTVSQQVDWELEIGTIMSQIERTGGPAVLFENVKDSAMPLACSTMGSVDRYALGLGMPRDLRILLNQMSQAFRTPIEPVVIESGPCQENVRKGDQINLHELPTPRWHVRDGGRYLGTLGILITKDPETGQTNSSIYRQQIVDRDKTCVLLGRDAGVMFRKYKELGQPMPVATCIGVEPALLAAAPMAFDYGIDELCMAGALRGKPVPVVKGKTV